jgi:hypothetical protein
MRCLSYSFCAFFALVPMLSGDVPAAPSPKAALQAFNDLIGSWRCTGRPTDSREQFWTETLAIEWQFKGNDALLKFVFDKGKPFNTGEHFASGELRYRPGTKDYELKLQTPKKETLTFAGSLSNRVLTLERPVGEEVQRLVFTLLHPNRFLYRYETRATGKSLVSKHWSVGATKEGESFASGDGKPECIVSGGAGTIAVAYQGKTYYVCCSGCRSEFLENPQTYIAEYEAKKAKKSK